MSTSEVTEITKPKPAFRQPIVANVVDNEVVRGNTLARIDTGTLQAIQSLPPRDLEQFEKNVLWEAARSGESFFYQWQVGGKTGGLVRGGSINMAMRMLAHYGKAVVQNELVNDNSKELTISSTFYDLETGVSFNRIFKQRKSQDLGEKMRKDADRQDDIILQIGLSKSMRNVILAAMPGYLVDAAIEKAQANELDSIEKVGIVAARTKSFGYLAGRGVTKERIEAKFGKTAEQFTARDIVELRGMCAAINDGEVDPAGMFPAVKADDGEPNAVKPEPAKADTAKPAPKSDADETPDGGFPGSFSETAHKNRGILKTYSDLCAKHGAETVHDVLPEFTADYTALSADAQKAVLDKVSAHLAAAK